MLCRWSCPLWQGLGNFLVFCILRGDEGAECLTFCCAFRSPFLGEETSDYGVHRSAVEVSQYYRGRRVQGLFFSSHALRYQMLVWKCIKINPCVPL